jgi:single-stranded-DNA-specific exonuclease
MSFEARVGKQFVDWLRALPSAASSHIHILCDFDGDGLPAGAILWRALHTAGYKQTTVECRRKGESAWGPEIAERLRERAATEGLDALIVADLGSRDAVIFEDIPTLLIDHHRPIGQPAGSTLITSYGTGDEASDGKDIATTGLLAYWCAQALCGETQAEEWLWLAGISILSDLGDKATFPELAAAKARFGGGALRDATSLLNAPRRTSEGRADAALTLLLKANGPKEVTSGKFPETAELLHAKEEVAAALTIARKQPPRFSKTLLDELGADLVMIRINTGALVHPLVAMQWRSRFPKSIVFGVNTGYRPGYVTFSGRAPAGVNLINFLARHRPEGADWTYGLGHNQASGGALPIPIWNRWVHDLGFGPEMQVEETAAQSTEPSTLARTSELIEEQS